MGSKRNRNKKTEIIKPEFILPDNVVKKDGVEFYGSKEEIDDFVQKKELGQRKAMASQNKEAIHGQLDILRDRCLEDAKRIDQEQDDMIQLALYHIIGNQWDNKSREVIARLVPKLFGWLKEVKIHPLTGKPDMTRKFSVFVFYGDHHLEYFKDEKYRETVKLIWWRYKEPVAIFDKEEKHVTGFLNNWQMLVEVDTT